MLTNNTIRLLQSKGIAHEVFQLPVEKLGAKKTAEILKVPIHQVFKTIVIKNDLSKKAILCVIPGDCIVDLKKIAHYLNVKKLTLPTEKEAEQITGLQSGGISPLALMNKPFIVLLDSKAKEFTEFHISGGQRGLNIKIGIKDFTELTKAKIADLSKPKDEE